MIPNAYVKQYENSLRHLAQQKKFTFQGNSDFRTLTGEFNFVENLGATSVAEVVARHAPTNITTADFQRRAIVAKPYDDAKLISENDDYLMQLDPKGAIITSQVAAMNRAKDVVFITAALGNALGGKEGTTVIPFDTANQEIPVNYTGTATPANSGLTLAKILEAKQILDSNDVDPDDEKFLVVTPKQVMDMLRETEKVSSADYVNVKAIIEAKIGYFAGFKWLVTNRLPKVGDDRTCFAYSKSAMVFGQHYDIKGYIDVREDLSHSTQVRAVWNGGAVRRDDKAVVSIITREFN
jgi:hypothetical protein